jgi:hypothetical protein
MPLMRRLTAGCLALSATLAACETTPTTRPQAPLTSLPAASTTKPAAVATHMTRPAPTAAAEGSNAITPEMLEALKQLSADSYQARQEAFAKLQQAMTKHFQQMLLVQEMMLKIQQNLAEQLQAMTMSPNVEAQAQVASLMEFNQALSRWAIDTLNLPPEQRDAMLKWGLSKEGYPLVAQAYARDPERRAAAALALSKLKNASATGLLGMLLDDDDRFVSLSAMDALWDKPLSTAMVDSLWNKATAQVMQQYRQRPQKVKNITVHGRTIVVYEQQYDGNRMQDADVAADVLINTKNPDVKDRLNNLLQDFLTNIKDPNDYRWRMLSPNNGDGGRILSRLIEAYKPKLAFTFVIRSLNSQMQDGYVNQINNLNYFQSSRVDAMGLFLKLTDQDPETFRVRKVANFGDRWMLQVDAKPGDQAGAMKEEQKLAHKLLAWWAEHYKEFGAEEPPKLPKEAEEDKNPAAPVAIPPGAIPPGMPGIRINGGPIKVRPDGGPVQVRIVAQGGVQGVPAAVQVLAVLPAESQPATTRAAAAATQPATMPATQPKPR